MTAKNLNLGEIVSVSRKGTIVESDNVRLEGVELQLNTEKVFAFSGNIFHKKSDSKIGTFSYACSSEEMRIAREPGCTIRVTNEQYLSLQSEATTLLLDAIAQIVTAGAEANNQ